jgi:hypothetical protein
MRCYDSRPAVSLRGDYEQNSTGIGLSDLDEALFPAPQCCIQRDRFEGCSFFRFVRRTLCSAIWLVFASSHSNGIVLPLEKCVDRNSIPEFIKGIAEALLVFPCLAHSQDAMRASRSEKTFLQGTGLFITSNYIVATL